jgi:lipopolysaccharide transport system permease protein
MMFNAIFVIGAFIVFWAVDGTLYLNVAPELLFAPLALLWMGLLAAVVGLVTGPVYWRARDIRYIYRLALPFLMFVTPIVYPVSRLDGALRTAAEANPLLAPVELFKASVLGTAGPPWHSVVIGIGTLVVLMAVGLWFTNRFAYAFLRTEEDDLDDA